MIRCIAAAALAALTALPALAEGRQTLGFARLFNNDAIGDGADRWRTGSYAVSAFRGRSWDGTAPAGPTDLIEWRLRSEVIQPSNLRAPAPDDRRYAGVLALGAFSHMRRGGFDLTAGLELVGVGPSTGVGAFQEFTHDILGQPDPAPAIATEIEDAVWPTARLEVARGFRTGPLAWRPFASAQAGAETLGRVGIDLTLGNLDTGMRLRDPVTGQLYPGLAGDGSGLSLTLGADHAWVEGSRFLDPAEGYEAVDRTRVRAALRHDSPLGTVFYGLTWMSEEFAAQPEGQVVGSLHWGIGW
ncbi:MAG: lipid A-modifier LpxR family protein [Hasllibacter sp.]